ncbi:dna repair protein rad57 [Venturia nashicola]|uniref:Dna repair protein rad57 n=1 Tax=Venturia nashicola TaxID=86259 RepID=A0A4Z1PC77_9PEZI|nr:dna repair protein rad57 [Venturia nashicola]TLD31950.1 dna repair protein rad57 [Venturia nashicola]
MTDLLHVLPDFETAKYSHLLPSLDKAHITTSDLLSLDAADITKRAQLPPAEVAKLADAVLQALQKDIMLPGPSESEATRQGAESASKKVSSGLREWQTISTLDDRLDLALGGGIPTGYMTEITGESGAGKTQFLLTLLLAAQLPQPQGLSRPTLYISTEAALSTSRLSQLLRTNPILSSLPLNEKPSLNRVLSIQTPDLESQEHILRFQVPVAIERQNVGLIVIDSIAANYRAEFERPGGAQEQANGKAIQSNNGQNTATNPDKRAGQAMAERKIQLVQLGSFLRNIAREKNIAIVISNQVADRFSPQPVAYAPASQPPASGHAGVLASTPSITPDPLTLDHQQRWFTGWGDLPPFTPGHISLKTPSLGLVWTNQIAARMALVKEGLGGSDSRKRKRWMRVVFAPWVGQTDGPGIEYEILAEGVRAVTAKDLAEDDNETQ